MPPQLVSAQQQREQGRNAVSSTPTLPIAFAVKVDTMHAYSGHIECDKNNDITSPEENTAAHWCHRGTFFNANEGSHLNFITK